MNIYEVFKTLVDGYGIIEVFGAKSQGKTLLAKLLVRDSLAIGKKVIYINTEKTIGKIPEGVEYVEIRGLLQLLEYVRDLSQRDLTDYVIIIDSIGLPALAEYVRQTTQDRKGLVLQKCIDILATLNEITYKNKIIALVTNQPESEFNKSDITDLSPFGDKSGFFVNEILKAVLLYSNPNTTKLVYKTFNSQKFGKDTELIKVTITKDNTTNTPTILIE